MEEKLVECLNFYPEEKGGVKPETMMLSSVDPLARLWTDMDTGERQYFQKWDKAKGKLVALKLPDVSAILPEALARVIGCPPGKKLKEIRLPLLEKIAPGVAIGALIIGAILFIVVLGG